MMISRNDLLCSTIVVGFIALANAATPVLLYYLWIKPDNLDTNQWTMISWWTLWIGHLAAYAPVAIFWPLSYAGDTLAGIYGFLWTWTETIGGMVAVTVFTFLLIAGIQWPSDKTVWETLIIYCVTQTYLHMVGTNFGESA